MADELTAEATRVRIVVRSRQSTVVELKRQDERRRIDAADAWDLLCEFAVERLAATWSGRLDSRRWRWWWWWWCGLTVAVVDCSGVSVLSVAMMVTFAL